MPYSSLHFLAPFVFKKRLTDPAPPKCAAARIPDSVILTPLIIFPEYLEISSFNSHLFFDNRATNAFSCNLGLLIKVKLSFTPIVFKVSKPN